MCLAFEFADIDQGHFEESSVYEVHYAKTPLVFDLLMLKDRTSILKKLVPFVTTKHEIWKHEAEWRYVGLNAAKTPVAYRKESPERGDFRRKDSDRDENKGQGDM